MNLAVIYARYSPRPVEEDSKESILAIEDHRSLMLQIETCEAYASLRKLTVAAVIKDAETSARKTKLHERTGGRELLDFLNQGVKHIIVQKVDRIFRRIDGRVLMDEWAEQGINLHLADQGGQSINCGTATGRLMAGVLLLFAEFEPAMISERTSGGMKRLQREGRSMSRHAPYGMRREGKLLVPDEYEQERIPQILAMSHNGDSARAIARFLNANGYHCRGGKFHNSTIRTIISREPSASPTSSASAPEAKLG